MKRSSTIDEFILDLTKYNGVVPQSLISKIFGDEFNYIFAKVIFGGKAYLIPLCIGAQSETDGELINSYFSWYDAAGDDFGGLCLQLNLTTGEFMIREY